MCPTRELGCLALLRLATERVPGNEMDHPAPILLAYVRADCESAPDWSRRGADNTRREAGFILIVLSLISLASACSRARMPNEDPKVVRIGTQEPGPEVYREGEAVTVRAEDTVYWCTDRPAYSIVQVGAHQARTLRLNHSCLGFVGTGIDQYCRDGQVQLAYVGYCSDAILCEKGPLGEIRWDQSEYTTVTESCGGQDIQREVEGQAPPGVYQIIINTFQGDTVVPKVVKEFVLAP